MHCHSSQPTTCKLQFSGFSSAYNLLWSYTSVRCQGGCVVLQPQESSGVWSASDCKNQANNEQLLIYVGKAEAKLKEGKYLSTLFCLQRACITELWYSSLKSIPWTNGSCPIDLLYFSSLRKECICTRSLHILWASFATALMGAWTLPSKQFLHKKFAINLLFDYSKHSLELNNWRN